jgi:hypothetical protein
MADRTNHVMNPSIETNTDGWLANYGGETLTRDAGVGSRGSASLKVETSAADEETQGCLWDGNAPGTPIVIAPDQTWAVSFDAKSADLATLSMTFHGHHAGGFTGIAGLQQFSLSASFQRFGHVFTVPDDNAYDALLLFWEVQAADRGKSFWLDGVLVEQAGELGSYFDGDSSGGAWTGTPHASISEYSAVVPSSAPAITAALAARARRGWGRGRRG